MTGHRAKTCLDLPPSEGWRVLLGRLRPARWKRISERDAAHLVDALRRSTEILAWGYPSGETEHARFEREHILQVNHRLLREYDPAGETDMKVA